jgi:hypothetical protein
MGNKPLMAVLSDRLAAVQDAGPFTMARAVQDLCDTVAAILRDHDARLELVEKRDGSGVVM